jgi:hypothetical protein
MFIKTKRGQIFPFLIALLCVLVILIMITVNLGQIGIHKTDVSNAADAAALAAVSVLSGVLVNIGLRSEYMCGRATEAAIMIALNCAVPPVGWIIAIIIYVVFVIHMWSVMMSVLGDTRMGFINANKTAMQYAFSNAGVDESRPSFKEFLNNAYHVVNPSSLAPDALNSFYNEYSRGETLNARLYAQGGFGRFLSDNKNGYWDEGAFGAIEPGSDYDNTVVNGYGWNDDGANSYDAQGNYRDYANWVEVDILGSSIYPLDYYSWLAEVANCIVNYINNADIPWWLEYIVLGSYGLWMRNFMSFFNFDDLGRYAYPTGIDFIGGQGGVDAFVNKNPVYVKVTRHKDNKNLGLWNFKHGDLSSNAQARVFAENSFVNIIPQCCFNIVGCKRDCQWFKDANHLFETELENAY